MKILNALILAASVVCLGTGAANAGKLTSCEFNGKPLHGKVQIVNSFPDFKVQIVNSFGDFKIRYVNSFPGLK